MSSSFSTAKLLWAASLGQALSTLLARMLYETLYDKVSRSRSQS